MIKLPELTRLAGVEESDFVYSTTPPPIRYKTLGQVLQELYQARLDEVGVASIDELFAAYKALLEEKKL